MFLNDNGASTCLCGLCGLCGLAAPVAETEAEIKQMEFWRQNGRNVRMAGKMLNTTHQMRSRHQAETPIGPKR
jgi:hypothetical protein